MRSEAPDWGMTIRVPLLLTPGILASRGRAVLASWYNHMGGERIVVATAGRAANRSTGSGRIDQTVARDAREIGVTGSPSDRTT